MNERKYFAVSIKHSEYRWRFGMPLVLWGSRTDDSQKRSFAGYTIYPNYAELYSLEDWKNSHYADVSYMKVDKPAKLTYRFCKENEKYDTVLIDADEYYFYCKMASLKMEAE